MCIIQILRITHKFHFHVFGLDLPAISKEILPFSNIYRNEEEMKYDFLIQGNGSRIILLWYYI